ncbi:MAG: SDR family NAD(P)-dependent oxidoreductase [Phycisphaerae bacterium]|nr:SDR family NAD(P)-dependent oxidoreductase [Phycisphaerae bacterium]
MQSEFDGRGIVVTGGTGALGSAVVARLIGLGATCFVPYEDEKELAKFDLRAHPSVRLAGPFDLSAEAAVRSFYDGLGSIWASVHTAGGFAYAPIDQTGEAELGFMLRKNAMTAFLCCRESVRQMRKGRGPGPSGDAIGGRIVNVAARPALEWRQGANMTAYTMSKSAVAALTEALGEEVAVEGILVNAVAPSIMDTRANRRAMPDADFTKWATLDDVSRTVVWLASPSNTVTRGAVVPVYGKS